MKVELDNDEWNRVLAILSQASWVQANPLIMKIAAQLQQQTAARSPLDGAGEPQVAPGQPFRQQ